MGCAHWVLAYICLVPFAWAFPVAEDEFIGWEGTTYNPRVVWKEEHGEAQRGSRNATSQFHGKQRWIEQISWVPRAYLFHNFLSDEECDHIIKAAAPHMKRSTVLGRGNDDVQDNIRTSYGTFLRRLQDDVISKVENRLAQWTHLPTVNQEDMQVLRYAIGQKYGTHSDVIHGPNPRMATVLMYLANVKAGGETAFPRGSIWIDPSLPHAYGPWSACAEGHVAVKARKGDALLFFSLHPDGQTTDEASHHTGCPVVEGIKWTATKWIHVEAFRPEDFELPHNWQPPADAGLCQDTSSRCKKWAESGECTKNPSYMIGENSPVPGACRKSCSACEECHSKDDPCYAQNRHQAGYLTLST